MPDNDVCYFDPDTNFDSPNPGEYELDTLKRLLAAVQAYFAGGGGGTPITTEDTSAAPIQPFSAMLAVGHRLADFVHALDLSGRGITYVSPAELVRWLEGARALALVGSPLPILLNDSALSQANVNEIVAAIGAWAEDNDGVVQLRIDGGTSAYPTNNVAHVEASSHDGDYVDDGSGTYIIADGSSRTISYNNAAGAWNFDGDNAAPGNEPVPWLADWSALGYSVSNGGNHGVNQIYGAGGSVLGND